MSRDRFHDLHQEKAGDSDHIRLISEGGNSRSRSPTPSCIDSIQVTQNCTTESQHTVYRSATGACTMFSAPDNSLFSVPEEHAQELDLGKVPVVLRTRLKQQGLPLAEAAEVKVLHPGRIWYISDRHKTYSVRKLASHFTVFEDAAARPPGSPG
jgi:hypothetical protein